MFRAVAKTPNISTAPSTRGQGFDVTILHSRSAANFTLKIQFFWKGTQSVFWYCLHGLLTLNLEAVRSSETSITVNQATQY